MARCIDCGYLLLMIERRRKYKCSRCGGLFFWKTVDDKIFQEWNKTQRIRDEEKIDEELKLKRKALRPRKYVDPHVRKEKLREYSVAHYEANKDKILLKKKEYRKLKKVELNIKKKEYRYSKIEETRFLGRLNYWRQRQKRLAISSIYY